MISPLDILYEPAAEEMPFLSALKVSAEEELSTAVVTVNTPVTSSACAVYALPFTVTVTFESGAATPLTVFLPFTALPIVGTLSFN